MAMNDKTLQMLQFLASQNICDGILYEPRIYCQLFDSFDENTLVAQSAPDLFNNGEDYAVRITHVLAGMQYSATSSRELLIQQYGLLIRSHDTYYMNPTHVPMPLWHNTRTASSEIVVQAAAAWKFAKPVYMGARDTFEVQFALEEAVDETSRIVTVAFNGVGALSRRPKQLAATKTVVPADGTSLLTFNNAELKNDGLEPLEIHEVVFNVGGDTTVSPIGSIQLAKFSVRLAGNGSGATWSIGEDVAQGDLVPGHLWGASVGRAVVHTLPKGHDGHPGFLWYPGMGVTVEVKDLVGDAVAIPAYPYVALAGYAIIK